MPASAAESPEPPASHGMHCRDDFMSFFALCCWVVLLWTVLEGNLEKEKEFSLRCVRTEGLAPTQKVLCTICRSSDGWGSTHLQGPIPGWVAHPKSSEEAFWRSSLSAP